MTGPKIVLDMKKLLEIEQQVPGRAAQVVQKIAQDCTALIAENWNSQQPSPPGEPPGVDTGALKNSVIAEPGDGALTWVVHDGVEYGVHLEYGAGDMAARPWLLPAVEETARMIPPDLLKEVVE